MNPGKHRRASISDISLDVAFGIDGPPLGAAQEKRDPSRFSQVKRLLGLRDGDENPMEAISRFEPDHESLGALLKIIRDESTELLDLGEDWVPIAHPAWGMPGPLDPVVDGPFRVVPLQPLIHAQEEGYLAEIREDYVESPMDYEEYQIDRNRERAFCEFYTPWIATFLFSFGIRHVLDPDVAMYTPQRVREKYIDGDDSDLLPAWVIDEEVGRQRQREFKFLQAIAWYSVIDYRKGPREVSPTKRISERMKRLWPLRELVSARFAPYAGIAEVSETAENALLRSIVKLGDHGLYEDEDRQDELEQAFDVVATSYRACPKENGLREYLSLLVAECIHVYAASKSVTYKGAKLREQRNVAIERQLMDWNARTLLESWDPDEDKAFSKFWFKHLKRFMNDHLRIPTVAGKPIRSQEFSDEEHRPEKYSYPRHSGSLDAMRNLEQLDDRRRIGDLSNSKALTPTQRQILKAYEELFEASVDTGVEVTAKAVAQRVGIDMDSYYHQWSEIKKRLGKFDY